jgi:hypothetical protein
VKTRRIVLCGLVVCGAVVVAWQIRSADTSPRHLKQDTVDPADADAEDSPFRIHRAEYDEVRQLQQAVVDTGGDEKTVSRLLQLTRPPGFWLVRGRACSGLGWVKKPEFRDRIVARMAECLRDPEGLVQMMACAALADQGAKHKIDDIRALLNSRNENVRKAVKHSLEKLGFTGLAGGSSK